MPQRTAVGQLTKRITLPQPATGKDAAGGPLPDVPGLALWACIDSISGQNLYQGTYVAQATHVVTIRYRPGLTASQRIRYAGTGFNRTFNILYIGNRFEANVWLDIFCEEIQ